MPAPTKRKLEDDRDRYRELWLDAVSALSQEQIKLENQRKVIIELYYSSFWSSDRLLPETEGYLWTKLKNVFNLDDPGPNRIHINDPRPGD